MIKRALIFSVTFLLVILIALFYIFDSFAVRDIAKRFIVTQSYYQLGMKVNVDDVRFSYFRPSVTVTNIELEKMDGDVKVKLSAPKARVSFKLLKLIRGKIALKGFVLESPKLELELEQDDIKNEKIDYKKYLDQAIAAKINNVEIKKADIWLKVDYKSGKAPTEISLKGFDLRVKEGLLYDYSVYTSIEDLKIPVTQVHSLSFFAELNNNSIKIKHLKIGGDGGELSLEGSVFNIDDMNKLYFDVLWKANFSLASIISYDEYLKNKDLYDFKGSVLGEGRVKLIPSKGMEGFSGSGSIKINNFLWGRYDVPKVEVNAVYEKDKVSISRIDVSDGVKSISVYDTTIGIASPYPIKGRGVVNDIELSRYLEMFGLKHCLSFFNIKGSFNFTGSIKPYLKISSLFDLKVNDFWVLYEKGLKPSEDNSVLSFKNGIAKGLAHFSAKGAYFDKFIGVSESNQLLVNGWIYGDGTMDLDVSSDAFSMEPYGRISALPLKGKGSLKTKLMIDQKGDFKSKGSINFSQTELMNKYAFGDVTANVVYDGVKLSFKDIKGKVGSSHYSGYTDLLFGHKTTISGRGDFKDIYTEDVYKLFNYQKKMLGSPSGFASGSVKFDGYPTWATIKLDAKIKMRDVEFFSERFDELYAGFIWNKGDIEINSLYLTKGKGRFDFKGGRKGKVFKLDVASKNLDASDLAVVSKQGVYLDGNIDVKGNVEQRNDKFSGSLKLNMLDLLMGDKKLKPVFLNLDIGEEITLKFKLFDKEVDGELKREGEDSFLLKAKMKDFNFYPIGSLFMPELEEFKTSIDGDVIFKFSTDQGIKSAVIDLSSFSLTSGAFNIKSKGNVYVGYNGSSYVIRPFTLISDSENVKCSMSVDNEGKKINVKGCVSAAALKLLKKYVTSSKGRIDVELYMGDKLNGSIYTKELELMTAEHKIGVLNINGRINIINDFANMDHLNITASGGTATFSGGLDLAGLLALKAFYPGTKLKMNIDKFYFEYPEGLKGTWSGNLELIGKGRPYNLNGELMLYDASYRKEFDITSLKFSDNKGFAYGKKKAPLFNLNVKAKTSSEIYIKNSIFSGYLTFDLTAKGTELDPKPVGSIDLLNGDIIYMDNDFKLTSGRVRFKDDESEPYVYQLDSEINTGSYQVFLKVVSLKGEPRFRLTSVPPLTEDKIVVLLATGSTQTDFTSSGAGGYGSTAGAGGQIVTQGMGVTGALRNTTGVGVTLKAPKTKDATVPDLELQKDLTNDIRLIYGKSLDEKATTNKQEVNVQYDVNRTVQLKLLLQEDTNNNVNKVPANNAGVDVKFKFEF